MITIIRIKISILVTAFVLLSACVTNQIAPVKDFSSQAEKKSKVIVERQGVLVRSFEKITPKRSI